MAQSPIAASECDCLSGMVLQLTADALTLINEAGVQWVLDLEGDWAIKTRSNGIVVYFQ